MLKQGVEIVKLTDEAPLQQASVTIRERAIRKATEKGLDANEALAAR